VVPTAFIRAIALRYSRGGNPTSSIEHPSSFAVNPSVLRHLLTERLFVGIGHYLC
jgi:hypothetical protein